MPASSPAAIYEFLTTHPQCSTAHLARHFSLPLRTAAAYRATFTRRTGLGGVPSGRHGGNNRPFRRPSARAVLELSGTGWVRLSPDADPEMIPEALQGLLLLPQRVRFTARMAAAPALPHRPKA